MRAASYRPSKLTLRQCAFSNHVNTADPLPDPLVTVSNNAGVTDILPKPDDAEAAPAADPSPEDAEAAPGSAAAADPSREDAEAAPGSAAAADPSPEDAEAAPGPAAAADPSPEDADYDRDILQSCTVAELRTKCKALGLATNGRKSAIIERLQSYSAVISS